MTTTNPMPANSLLGEIRSGYSRLRMITQRLLDDFSLPALQNTVAERSQILRRISTGESALRNLGGSENWMDDDQYREIKEQIAYITVLDKELVDRVSGRMNNIRNELSSLSDTSHAAKSYTRYARA